MTPPELTAQQRVIWLIRTLDDAQVEYGETEGSGLVKLMPRAYREGSYQELERVLTHMRHTKQIQLRWHVMERYRRGQHQTLSIPIRRRRHGFDLVLPPNCELAPLTRPQTITGANTARAKVIWWNPRVDMTLVDRGVNWITRTMYGGHKARIVLPDDLYRRVLGLEPRERPRPVATVAA